MVDVDYMRTPLKWYSISLKEIISCGTRLEASVYGDDVREAFRLVENGKYACIPLYGETGFVKKAGYGNRLKRHYVSLQYENKIGFIGSSEMLDIYPRPVKFMADGDKCGELRVKQGMVLLSRSGTIGNVVFCNKTLSKFLVSEHAIRLECENFPGYLYAFLKTKTGKRLICSRNYGAVVTQIEPAHLADIPIPDAPLEIKKKIHDLIIKSYGLRDESNELIDEAMALLVRELNLPEIDVLKCGNQPEDATVETFSVKLSELEGRIDASYHIPIAKNITEHLRKYSKEVTTLENPDICRDIILPGRFKRVYAEEGHGCIFIGGKQLGELDPAHKKYLSFVHHKDMIAGQLKLHENMILITCSGTIGKVVQAGKHWENWTASQHIIRVVPADTDIAGYLYVFLSSDYGRELITRHTYGSVVDEIDDCHVSRIPIPLLKNESVQDKINELALSANQKRYEAYRLEQRALKVMNEEVIYAKL